MDCLKWLLRAWRTSQTRLSQSGSLSPATMTTEPHPPRVDEPMIGVLFPGCHESRRAMFVEPINSALSKIGATTKARAAAFIGQIGHESLDLRYMREIWSPKTITAQQHYERDRACAWPPTDADPTNRKAWLLGNSEPGDGFAFRGAGPLQVTGRGNVAAGSRWLYGDGRLLIRPELLDLVDVGFGLACWFWMAGANQRLSRAAAIRLTEQGYPLETFCLNDCADRGDWHTLTMAINGGLLGFSNRLARIDRALGVLYAVR